MSDEVKKMLEQMASFEQMVEDAKVAAVSAAEETADAAEVARSSEQVCESKLCACVEAAYLIASADGAASAEEVSHIKSKMGQMTNHAFDNEHIGALIQLACDQCESEGHAARIGCLANCLPDEADREMGFLLAAATSWTGGGIGVKEDLALQAIARSFGWEINKMHKLLAKAHA